MILSALGQAFGNGPQFRHRPLRFGAIGPGSRRLEPPERRPVKEPERTWHEEEKIQPESNRCFGLLGSFRMFRSEAGKISYF